MKKAVISFSILVVLLAIAGYFGKTKYDSMLNATSEGLSYGKSFGKMVNQSKCLLGLKAKYFSCDTVECELSANGYISGCLNTASKDEFCKAVPNIKDTDQALSWVSKTCTDYNLGTAKCLKYMHKFVSVCTEQTDGKALSNKDIFESGFKKGLKTGQSQ